MRLEDLNPDEIAKITLGAEGSMKNITTITENLETWNKLNDVFDRFLKGETNLLTSIINDYTKDKTQLSDIIFLLQTITRNKLKVVTNYRKANTLAQLLANLSQANYYIFERNINASYLLSQILINALSGESLDDTYQSESINDINQVIV